MKTRWCNSWAMIGLCAMLLVESGCSRRASNAWARFAAKGVSYQVPTGWTCADPFTTATPFWSHLWYHDSPTYTTRLALLQSPAADQYQFMLMLGEKTELKAFFDKYAGKYDTDVLLKEAFRDTVKTVDGTAVDIRGVHIGPGVLAGEDVTYLLGYAEVGDQAFLLNAGGLTRGYKPETYRSIVQSLVLGKK